MYGASTRDSLKAGSLEFEKIKKKNFFSIDPNSDSQAQKLQVTTNCVGQCAGKM